MAPWGAFRAVFSMGGSSYTSGVDGYTPAATLTCGQSYIFTETTAPRDYEKLARAIVVKAAADGSVTAVAYGSAQSYAVSQAADGTWIVTVPNIRKTADVIVSKSVGGNLGDRSKDFSFSITLTDAENNPIQITGLTDADGKGSFTLRHGQSKTLSGLPVGAKLTVTEDPEGYTASYVVGSSSGSGPSCTLTVAEAGASVTFTNTLSQGLDLGLWLDENPYFLLLTGAITATVLLIALDLRRKIRRERA